jgi:hypothetical protein
MIENRNNNNREVGPLAHQITEVSITLKNGAQVSTYTIHTKKEIKDKFAFALGSNSFIEIETGSKSPKYENSEIIIPASEIVILAVSDVVQPSNIIKPRIGLEL